MFSSNSINLLELKKEYMRVILEKLVKLEKAMLMWS